VPNPLIPASTVNTRNLSLAALAILHSNLIQAYLATANLAPAQARFSVTSRPRDDIDALLLHEVQELQGRAGRTLLTDFPLLHSSDIDHTRGSLASILMLL
jgi:hypothetical protein